ncbi:tryptophan-rich sensory protein TspO [Jannaschia aquimarina]|uniref:TspO/MBR family protein n=1 Tax=Jannaschia aquimarina TaxID=935700 RepID=A0A0D1EAW7_9RHOB|nr:TspO/MBR family protein [Jannaschia aquimarina]KIT14869.1 TspO/MBR family protein [Jannaschia aquimarina]SNS57965.1 TspO and MBR related proteins [Jannaschia aquimarina]
MDWVLFLIFLAACGAAATTGAVFPPGDWYKRLDKPSWTPPDWLFPVAWTLLYLSLAYVGARIATQEGAAYALAFWAMQIAFNTLWTPIFFGLRKIGPALIVIAGLWIAVLGLVWSLWPLDTLAFWLTVPYLIWVSYAAALNADIWRRNRGFVPVAR